MWALHICPSWSQQAHPWIHTRRYPWHELASNLPTNGKHTFTNTSQSIRLHKYLDIINLQKEAKHELVKHVPKIPQMTLWPPGACPPDKTTPILSFWLDDSPSESLGTITDDGCPYKLGKSFAISSAKTKYHYNHTP